MDSKKSNIKYTLFIVTVLAIFSSVFIISSFTNKEGKNYSENYNKAIEFEDWYVKINNAIYIPESNTIEFTFHIKAKFAEPSTSKPEISLISTNLSYKKCKDYYAAESDVNYTNYIVSDIETDFTYLNVYFTTSTPDIEYPDQVDAFGEVISGGVQKGEVKEARIRIDKQDMLTLSEKERATFTTENTSIMTTTTGSKITTNHTAAGSLNSSENSTVNSSSESVTTTKATVKLTKTESSSVEKETSSNAEAVTKAESPAHRYNYNGGGGAAAVQPNTTEEYQVQEPQTTTATETITTTVKEQQTDNKTSSENTQQTNISVYAIKLQTDFPANNITLNIGQTAQITPVISPQNATNKEVIWTSNRTDIAVIDENGKVTAVSSGRAIITAKSVDGGLEASCMVTVS